MAVLSQISIALAETRELDRLAQMLEADGATVVRCPMLAILDAPDPRPVDAWLKEACNGGFDDLILLTGEGLRRLLARAEVTGCRDVFVAALGRMRRITRGPKPARVLHELGLRTDLPATVPTSAGIMDMLATHDLGGRRIGLQLYGSDPNLPLVRFLEGAGARVYSVAPYVYAQKSDDDAVMKLIADMAQRRLHAVVFTSAAQVDRLFAVAHDRGNVEELRDGLDRVKVAAIGPVAAEALEDRGRKADIVPEEPFVMKRLTQAIAAALGHA